MHTGPTVLAGRARCAHPRHVPALFSMSAELVAAGANKRGKADSAARGVRVVAACSAALALGCLCAGLLGLRARSRSALLTLSDGETWYAANKDYGTDGTEAGVNMVTWYPLHKNVSNVERTWWAPHRGKQADVDWYTKHMPRHAAQAASIRRAWRPDSERLHALSAERKRRQQMLYGSSWHLGGVGSEGYGTPAWDNSGWNGHYHPRDGASMDSESMEPWYWRKGPNVNDEYTGHMADGDPLYSPPEGWEPPIEYHDSAYLPEAANAAPDSPLLERMSGMKTNPYA